MSAYISKAQWEAFEAQGYLHLGNVMADGELAALQQRIDEIMMGTASIDYDRVMMQLDSDPAHDGQPGPQSKGHKIPTLAYRKIQDLEWDDRFRAFLQKPMFREICEQVYGKGTPVDCFRAMFMNKPAREGTPLVWHQDRWTDLTMDPQITIWTALDPTSVENGCVKIIPGSHRELINPEHGSGFLTDEHIETIVSQCEPVDLILEAGDSVLLHNWMLHSSGVNETDIARRAFSVCYMHGATRSLRGKTFTRVFGNGAIGECKS